MLISCKLYNKSFIKNNNNTYHYNNDRMTRNEFITTLFDASTKVLNIFLCDTGHKNGKELHIIYNNGVIAIYNERTKKHITDLIARPQQIKRYYEMTNTRCQNELIKIAREHQKQKLNYK